MVVFRIMATIGVSTNKTIKDGFDHKALARHFNQPCSTTVLNSSPNRNTNVMAAIQLVQLADAICNKMLFGISCQEHCAVGVLGSMTLSSYSFFQPLKRISSH